MPPMIRKEENDDVDNYFKLYGQILWLWSHSKLHCSWDVDIQSGLVMPATVLKQFQIIYDDNQMPAAYCSWALLSDKHEINYILNPSTIPLDHWSSGQNIWIMDFISPFSGKYTQELVSKLKLTFSGQIVCALRVKATSNTGRIKMFFGDNFTPGQIINLRKKKLDYFQQQLKQRPGVNADFSI